MKQILIVGDIMLDRWIHTSETRVSPETNVPILVEREIFEELGGMGNAWRHCSNLNSTNRISTLTVIGNDLAGNQVSNLLQATGHSHYSLLEENRRTTVKSRIFQDGKPLLRLDSEDIFQMQESTETKFISLASEILPTCESVLISDYGKGVVTKRVVETVSELARSLGIMSVIDIYPPTLFWVEGIDVVKPNQFAWSKYIEDFASEKEAIDDLLIRRNIKCLLITRGSKGMTYIDRTTLQNFSAERASAIDVTGAGDSIAAGVVTLASKYSDLQDIIPILLQIGSKTVSLPRTELPLNT